MWMTSAFILAAAATLCAMTSRQRARTARVRRQSGDMAQLARAIRRADRVADDRC